MKKTYQNPTMHVIEIELQQMIAESIGMGSNYDGTSPIQSRRGGFFWDDDEDLLEGDMNLYY